MLMEKPIRIFPKLYLTKRIKTMSKIHSIWGGIYDLSLNFNRYTETGNFTATLSKMDQDSYIPYADFSRYSISIGGNQTLANGVRIGGNVAFSRNEQNGPMFGNNQSSGIGASSFARAFNSWT